MSLVLVWGSGCVSFAETPGERFQKVMKEMADLCQSKKLIATDSRCILPKIKPADPLATEEGRFAHSIKIPNPVPEDSGYKPEMTPEQYFDHLCKAEAGEFIYKTVENVEGLYQMRPRPKVNYEANHLYALEEPYGGPEGSNQPEYFFVQPGRYRFFESSALARKGSNGPQETQQPSYSGDFQADAKVVRSFGYDGHKLETMQKENVGVRKSGYGYTWRGITRSHDRELGVGGSELVVLDLQTNEVLAVHRGYAKFEIDERFGTSGLHWIKRCPKPETNMGGGARLQFLLKVLKPASGFQGK
ncbi:MAG: hypothetical protein ACREIJ_07065 [Nitrospiraceae bacterium]